MPKLTKKLLDTVEIRKKEYCIFDDSLPCFGVRIQTSGRKSYIVQYRDKLRKSRRKTLGKYGFISLEDARKKAFKILAAVQSGEDPGNEERVQKNALTVKNLAMRFIEEHAEIHLKKNTIKEYKRSLDKVILPEIGHFKVTEITRADISAFHHSKRKTPYAANRYLATISKIFNLVEMWGLRPDGTNPCRHIKKYPEKQRERFLSIEETKRLGVVLKEMEAEGIESRSAINCIKLLFLTGCRFSEIQTLQWKFIDWNTSIIRLPDSKTGARIIYASKRVITLLQAIKDNPETPPDNPYVIYGALDGAHLVNVRKSWQRICKRADLEGVRIHDLRHSFASYAVSQGMSLPMIGKLLGHTQVQTTARYAHLMHDSITQAADQASDNIASLMS